MSTVLGAMSDISDAPILHTSDHTQAAAQGFQVQLLCDSQAAQQVG